MAKTTSVYLCQQCGADHPKWTGKCASCGSWNSLTEEIREGSPFAKGKRGTGGRTLHITNLSSSEPAPLRLLTDIGEFDRVCGGGLVPGSVLLVGGDPGIGKSTLLLQVAAHLSRRHPCLYISGEEGVEQIRLRAARLGVSETPLALAASTHMEDIKETLMVGEAPKLVIIDSIQTMYMNAIESVPGSVSQIRAATHEFVQLAKKKNMIVVLVGHVTKEGVIAGPRVLEHMVDTVLYFEGERGHQFRILRSVKNRFGATDEIGVFEMTPSGLQEVLNPSSLFLSERSEDVSGSSVFAGMEGTRPVLVEIQALVASTTFGTPRRAVIGWDQGRLAMILAVLETRCRLSLGPKDIYLNVAGGLKISEPAADMSVAASLISALSKMPLPPKAVFFGEIGLSGEVRAVSHMEARLKEASKLGFSEAYCPPLKGLKDSGQQAAFGLKITPVQRLQDLIAPLMQRRKNDEEEKKALYV